MLYEVIAYVAPEVFSAYVTYAANITDATENVRTLFPGALSMANKIVVRPAEQVAYVISN